ncbi:hypothetical protein ND486_21760 [Pseudonocardia sp. DR1-2]|nr:hypothetical protein [Pseudonocardia sp. DR1-2]MCM3848822.1 hypothetical protein [Pseudonocardia sp. DR1-2]
MSPSGPFLALSCPEAVAARAGAAGSARHRRDDHDIGVATATTARRATR